MPTMKGRASRLRIREASRRGSSVRVYETEARTESGVTGLPKERS